MQYLCVEIVAFADESFPGFVECVFVDAEGNLHAFIEKVPVVTLENLRKDSAYPQTGSVPCECVERSQDNSGRRLARVTIDVCDSRIPDSASYLVLESQLTDC
jgi:hypothetical protein